MGIKAIIPLDPNDPGGSSVEAEENRFEELASRDRTVLLEFFAIPEAVTWFGNGELMYCQRQHQPNLVKVIRKATEDERKKYRVPLWIQSEEIPECCGRPMNFVGQIDDDNICVDRPPDANLWWHDAASFYVFTCSQCLEVKAVGQQF